jgi:membrane peptidoglycan carboxypeptidase
LAAQGRYCAPYGIARITTATGRVVQRSRPDCHRVMSAHVAQLATSILRGVIDGPDASRTGASATIHRPAAGKTGTTDSFAAAWFTGFTPQLAASVWVGDPRGGIAHPLTNVRVGGRLFTHVYGADLPASVWRTTMLGALAGEPTLNFQGIAAQVARDITFIRRVVKPKPAHHRGPPPGAHGEPKKPRPPKHHH